MKIFLSYGNAELSEINNLKVINPFTSKEITNGIILKDNLIKILKENYSCNVFDYMTSYDPEKGWFELYRDEIIKSDIIIFLWGEEATTGQIVEKNIIERRIDKKGDYSKSLLYLILQQWADR
ncbi:MAG: hypothetical protein IPH20_24090 [Bacteroidales bacterium]|nr:hypothetical protein [Bacteroidales bacterium]